MLIQHFRRIVRTAVHVAISATALLSAGSTLSAANLYYSNANGAFLGGSFGVFGFNRLESSGSRTGNSGPLSQSVSGSASLLTNELKARAASSNDGSDPDNPNGFTNVTTAIGDTMYYTGPVVEGQDITLSFDISGSWSTLVTGEATTDNYSYLRAYFLKPGSMDNGFLGNASNIIADKAWGIGPGAQPAPWFTGITFGNDIPNVSSANVQFGVDMGELESGFQVLVVLQTLHYGDTHGDGTFSWNINLGDTIGLSFQAPDGVILTQASSLVPTPEPASIGLAGLGVVLFALQKYRGRRG